MAKPKTQEDDFIEEHHDRQALAAGGRDNRRQSCSRILGWRATQVLLIGIEPVADKRGVTDRLKSHVRAESAAQAGLRETFKHPLAPSKRSPKPRAAQTPAPEWGTLEWYRNELAIAQDRIRLLESERDALLAEKRERDPVLQYVVEEPSKRASQPRKRHSPYAEEFSKWSKAAIKELLRDANANAPAMARAIKQGTHTEAADRRLRKWVADHNQSLHDEAAKQRRALQIVRAARHSGT